MGKSCEGISISTPDIQVLPAQMPAMQVTEVIPTPSYQVNFRH